MKKTFIAIVFLFLYTSLTDAQISVKAGSFARMGFGARGMAMGNALTAVINGEISTYYNPALSCFAAERTAMATFSILSLDRYLNFLSYTQAIQPTAGISVGLINAGVKNIDGRNSDGVHTEDYSTFENQFYLAFSNRVHENVSIGIAVKLYYSKLFDEVKSTTVGFDLGANIIIIEGMTAGITIQDLGSKYLWDTKAIYPDPLGKTTTDRFPTLRRLGLSYQIPGINGIVSAEFENSSQHTNVFRFGAEYAFMEYFQVRGGIDR
ncbi:MAG: hypothetical protein HY800_09750, partial [Ignavibacteriales bacterium]|nr:hypothetical protein [Ignavibacteriales bacterium]